jgi:putative transcriptional regulator
MRPSENIQNILKEKGINAYKMSKDIEISHSNLYDILNGKNDNPRIRTIKKIADYLNVTVDELLK